MKDEVEIRKELRSYNDQLKQINQKQSLFEILLLPEHLKETFQYIDQNAKRFWEHIIGLKQGINEIISIVALENKIAEIEIKALSKG